MEFLKKMMTSKKPDTKPAAPPAEPSKRNVMGGKNKQNNDAMKEAGMKKGGEVRGYGAARKPMKKGGACR